MNYFIGINDIHGSEICGVCVDERWLTVGIINIADNCQSFVTGKVFLNDGGHEKILYISSLVSARDCSERRQSCRKLMHKIWPRPLIRRSSRDDKSQGIFVVGLVISLSTDPIGLNGAC
jgi:hypothetical protein